jgi:ABC-type phosphate transport system substrate-binding protein
MSQHISDRWHRTAAAWACAGALIAIGGTTAQAQLGIYGGGASLPAIANRNLMNCFGDNSAGSPPELGSPPFSTTNPPGVFDCRIAPYPINPNVEFLYLSVGSGNGRRAWREHNPASLTFNNRVPDASPTGASGDLGCFYDLNCANNVWERAYVGQTPDAVAYPKIHYAGSDDPLVPSDITTYEATSGPNHDFGPPKQVPIAVAAIGLAFSPAPSWNPKGKVFGLHDSKVMLSRDTWCGIMTGAIITWNNAEITDDNSAKGVGGNTPLGTGGIAVVYRDDASGTTSLFSNALVNQCGSTTHPVAGSAHPVPDAWLADQIPPISNSAPFSANRDDFFIRVAAAGHLPANFIAATGNGGVRTAILAGAGRIGYLTPNAFHPYDASGPKVANLQIWDNVLDIDQGLTNKYKYAEPSPKKGTAIMGAQPPPSFAANCASTPGGCWNEVLKWAPANPLPLSSKAYAIGGFTMALSYTCYADSNIVEALTNPFGAGTPGYFTWLTGSKAQNGDVPNFVLAQKGLAALPAGWESAVKKLLLTDSRSKIRTAPDTSFPVPSQVCPNGAGA